MSTIYKILQRLQVNKELQGGLVKKSCLIFFFLLAVECGYSFAYHLYQLTTKLSLSVDSGNNNFSVKERGYFSEMFFLRIFLKEGDVLHRNQKYALKWMNSLLEISRVTQPKIRISRIKLQCNDMWLYTWIVPNGMVLMCKVIHLLNVESIFSF